MKQFDWQSYKSSYILQVLVQAAEHTDDLRASISKHGPPRFCVRKDLLGLYEAVRQ